MSIYEVKVRVTCAACDRKQAFWARPRVETRPASNSPEDDSVENHVEFDPPHPPGWGTERDNREWPPWVMRCPEMRCPEHRTR